MVAQNNPTFFVPGKRRYLTIIALLLPVLILLLGVIYCSYSLKNSFLYSYRRANVNLKTVLESNVIKKYYFLSKWSTNDFLTNQHYNKSKHFDSINQLVKLSAELLQAVEHTEDINLVLYDRNYKPMIDNLYTQDHEQLLLLSDQIDLLFNNQDIHYTASSKLISIFPILYEGDLKPLFFLKILRKYDNYCIIIYNLLLVFMSLLFIVLALMVYYFNTSNIQVLAKQHKTNIELQHIKEVLEQENANKLKFFASITHELRTPLNAIIGFSELIKGKSLANALQCKEYANDIYHAGTHLLSLINDILDFSKAEASSLKIEKVKFNLNKIVDSCLNMLSPKLKEAGIRLEKELPEKQLLIIADPKRMKQVIINLLSNAIKFTPEHGLIKMVIGENIEKNQLTIEFHDNGIGIMQQDICKVMTVFGQVDSGYRNEGTGIGLPLSKKLVELMGGIFDIKSEAKLGTTVTLSFFYEEQTSEESNNF